MSRLAPRLQGGLSLPLPSRKTQFITSVVLRRAGSRKVALQVTNIPCWYLWLVFTTSKGLRQVKSSFLPTCVVTSDHQPLTIYKSRHWARESVIPALDGSDTDVGNKVCSVHFLAEGVSLWITARKRQSTRAAGATAGGAITS